MGVLGLRHTMRRTCMLGALLVCGVSNAQSQRADLVAVYVNAIENNAAYRSAVLQYNAALEARPAARGKLLPQLGVQAEYDWIRQEVDGTYYGFEDVSRGDTFERYAYGAAFSQTVYRLDQFIDLKKADSQIGQARLALADAKDELQIGVAKAYFALLSAQETLTSVRAEKEAVARQLDQMQGRFDSGLVADADLKAAQSRQDLVLADEISAENEVEIARTQIELVSGRLFTDLEGLPADVPLPPLDYEQIEDWIDRAMQHNLPLLEQTVVAHIAGLEYDKARALRMPQVDVVGSYAFFDQNGGISGAREDLDERIGVAVTLPLYSGGQIATGIRYADKLQKSEQALLDQARAQALQDTRSGFLNARSALARSRALDHAVQSAIAAEEAAQVGFDVGTRTQAELLNAVRERYAAQRDFALARYAYVLATLELKRAAGKLTAGDLDEINSMLR
ncbi:MAG: TolC family outer membrane protein [Pseudomonadota bacterium]|nr:TolC family outer membrane protein [Pseudomonadota bacterium]